MVNRIPQYETKQSFLYNQIVKSSGAGVKYFKENFHQNNFNNRIFFIRFVIA